MEKLEVSMEIAAEMLKKEAAEQMIVELGDAIREFLEKMVQAKIIGAADLEFGAFTSTEEEREADANARMSEVPEQTILAMDQLLQVQRLTVETELFRLNDYMRGMYNGMELLMATLDDREPLYLDEFGEFSKTEGGQN